MKSPLIRRLFGQSPEFSGSRRIFLGRREFFGQGQRFPRSASRPAGPGTPHHRAHRRTSRGPQPTAAPAGPAPIAGCRRIPQPVSTTPAEGRSLRRGTPTPGPPPLPRKDQPTSLPAELPGLLPEPAQLPRARSSLASMASRWSMSHSSRISQPRSTQNARAPT